MARIISDSGGRTSGYMTKREIDKGLGPDDYIVFTNTGLEREETLLFVKQQAEYWGVKIWWIEFDSINKWKEVTYETASRIGEPFTYLICDYEYLPNPTQRFCTSILKIRVMRDFMRSMGYNDWVNLIGFRKDEAHRVANSKGHYDRWENEFPLYRDGISKWDVNVWWGQQPFNLQLQSHEGNCDLCHMKGKKKKIDVLRRKPEIADWWLLAEEFAGARFRSNYSVRDLVEGAKQYTMFDQYDLTDDEPTIACFCGETENEAT